ncbi:hypothetical protein JCM24511_07707 [Saitozyma sp. JCM 24511]|nr:hypothetical protein JCM24511_07707 [Saitozyma sp. JCM 24511]
MATDRSRLSFLQHVLFYDHEIHAGNPFELAVFSQWFPSPFVDPLHPGVTFATAEHYMMYRKALGDQNFSRLEWQKHADDVVERANYLKFGQNADLMAVLLATGEAIMVEASPVDRIWGIGFSADEARGKEEQWGANRYAEASTCNA